MTSSTFNSEHKPFSWGRLLLQFASVLIVFAFANVAVYYHTEYFEKARANHELVDLAARKPGVRVLFAGDSHVAEALNGGLNADPKATGFSVAFRGDSARECFAKIRRVLELSKGIDTIAVSVDPHMFGTGRVESSNRSFSDRYFIADGDSSGLRQGWLPTLLDQVPLFNDDFVQYLRRVLLASFSTHRSAPRGAGEILQEGVATTWQLLSDDERAEQARRTGDMDHRGVGQEQQPLFWYGRILELARERHLSVIGVRFPVHSEYSAQASVADVANVDEFLHSHGLTKIVDLHDALADPGDFEDEDHVNQTGAAKLLALLAPRLDHLFYAGSPAEPAQH
ncbi:MAG: hypothetical protein ABI640_21695 [Gammaproteobacteria bacterium]